MTIIRYNRHKSKTDAKSFLDLQRVFSDLVPFKSTIGNPVWLVMYRDKKTQNLYPYYKDIELAKSTIAENRDKSVRCWSMVQEMKLGRAVDKNKGEVWPLANEMLKSHRDVLDELEPKYCLSIRTYPDVELLKVCYKNELLEREIFDPDMSLDAIVLKYGSYNYIQIRPGKIILNKDGSIKHKDPFAFKVKTFSVPATNDYLELMLNRIYKEGN